MVLVRRATVPANGFTVVLQNAAALVVQDAEVELRAGVTLACREAVPLGRLAGILSHPSASVVRNAQPELCVSAALVGGPSNSRFVLAIQAEDADQQRGTL